MRDTVSVPAAVSVTAATDASEGMTMTTTLPRRRLPYDAQPQPSPATPAVPRRPSTPAALVRAGRRSGQSRRRISSAPAPGACVMSFARGSPLTTLVAAMGLRPVSFDAASSRHANDK